MKTRIAEKLYSMNDPTDLLKFETVEKIFNMFAKTKTNTEFIDTLKAQVVKKNKEN